MLRPHTMSYVGVKCYISFILYIGHLGTLLISSGHFGHFMSCSWAVLSSTGLLKVHHAFERHGGLELDGLVDEAYVRAVYGNPPFDGNLTNCDTINTALDKAAMTANHTNGYVRFSFFH
jgi:hypothetical protein